MLCYVNIICALFKLLLLLLFLTLNHIRNLQTIAGIPKQWRVPHG